MSLIVYYTEFAEDHSYVNPIQTSFELVDAGEKAVKIIVIKNKTVTLNKTSIELQHMTLLFCFTFIF